MKQHKYLLWLSLLLALVMGFAVPAHAAEPLFDGDASKLTGSNWMSGISGSRKLSDITLPGTYHSGTSNVYLDNQTTSLKSASEYIMTQERTIPQQLTDGVRVIDLHVTSNKPTSGFWDDSKDFLWVCRNMTLAKKNLTFYAQNPNGSALTLRAALNYVRAFLNRNPTETVIVNICEEGGTPDARFKLLRKTLDEYAAIKTKDGRSLMYLTNSMPELREVRGRIVVCTPHPNLLGANPGMQLPTMQEAIDSRDNSSVGGVKARPRFGYASRTKDWSQELPDSASKHASYLSVLYTCVVPQTDAHSSNVDPNNNRPIKEMAALINDDLYGGSNPVFKAGRLCGWTFSEYMDAAKAKVAWQTNFPSNLKYHTIVYGSDQHSKKDYVTTKVLTGSELVLPECMLPVPNTAPLFGGWEVSGKTYKPGEKLPNRIIADVKVWAQYRTTNTWAALGDYLDGLKSGANVSLTIDRDLTATTLDHVLHVPKGATVVLDLAGHTLNRNIASAAQADGSVLLVEGSLTLKNGTVMGGNTSGNGGGVLVSEGATLALEDVMVRNNRATGTGGGVYVSPTTSKLKTNFSVAGSTRINEVNNVAAGAKSNVTLAQGSKIAVAKNLSAAASVSVTSADPVLAQSKSASVTKGSALASKATLKHFASDDERYAVANRSNDVYLVGWYTVKFDSKGGTPVSAQRVAGFMPVEKPKDPTFRGVPFNAVDKYNKCYKFMGWYKQGASTPYDFSKPVTSDLTLVAKWYVQAALHAGAHARFTEFPAAAADVQMVAPTTGAYSQAELNKLVAAGTVVRDLEFVLPPGGAFDVSNLKVETDEGYSFDGTWMYNAHLQNIGVVWYRYDHFNNMRMPAEFFARITRNKVSITLDLNGGVGGVMWDSAVFGTNRLEVLFGSTLSEREYSGLVRIARWKSKPQRANHRLRGDGYKAEWYLDKDCTVPFDRNVPIKVSQTFYLGWQLNTHTVTFVTQGGSEVAPQTVEYGKPATVPDAPTRAGKVFCGWYTIADAGPNDRQYDFATPVTGDLKLYARWIDAPKEYVVAFDAAGGSEVADQKVVEGEKAARPADPVREGYTFRGWQLDGVDYDFDKPVTRDLTLKASWDVATYTVTFDTSEYYEGISYVGPAPQHVKHGGRARYKAALVYVSAGQGTWRWFEGWSLNGKPYEFSTPVTGDITLTARWHFRYLVSFVPSVSLPSGLRQQIVKDGESAEEPEIPAGYEVEGYSVDDGGLRPYDFATPVTKHIQVLVQLRAVEPAAGEGALPNEAAGDAAGDDAAGGDTQPGAGDAAGSSAANGD
ncbi:MAG: InlB B-repeat-containing protein, partial [Atopobiaceae bacterium]|nr:InlB B-repeat-containing protein [Atopobiaceae bacterium]